MSCNSEKHEKVVKDVESYRKQPIVPDGGWGWVVCFAAACTNFTVTGLTTSAGIFLIGLKKIFDGPVWKLALVGALLDGLSMIAAPVASILLVYFSHRTVMILAGLLGFTGAILGVFSTSIEMMIATYGIITGVSLGMSFFTCQIITGLYFDKKRALAIGINNCGGGMGTMLVTLFFEYFLEIYGLRGTLLLVSGLLLNGVVFGVLCRPLPSIYTNAGKTAYLDETNSASATEPSSASQDSVTGGNINQKEKINEAFVISDEKENMDCLSTADKKETKDESIIKNQKVDRGSIMKRCLNMIGAEHFRNTNFVLLTMSYILWVCVSALCTYIPPLCVWSLGMSQRKSAVIMMFVGLFTTLGELLLGVFVDLLHFSSKKVYIVSLLVLSTSAAIFPYCNSFVFMAVVACIFGFSNGFAVSLRLVLTTDIVGLEHSTAAFSILSLFCGISYFSAPPLFGLVFDTTKSFIAVFYGGGACALTSLILFLLIVCRDICHEKCLKK